jgi:hypothetical protein
VLRFFMLSAACATFTLLQSCSYSAKPEFVDDEQKVFCLRVTSKMLQDAGFYDYKYKDLDDFIDWSNMKINSDFHTLVKRIRARIKTQGDSASREFGRLIVSAFNEEQRDFFPK